MSANTGVATGDAFWNSLETLEGQHWISHGFRGRGELQFAGCLRISGEWTGRIRSQESGAQLHVMGTGVVSGALRMERLSVEGQLKDVDVEVKWMRVRAGARVYGRIKAETLIVDEGAIVEGRIVTAR
jgi:cytoskeletal protein CcmA (bactofilin family)